MTLMGGWGVEWGYRGAPSVLFIACLYPFISVYMVIKLFIFLLLSSYADCRHVRSSGYLENGTYTLWMNDTASFKVSSP